MAALFLAACDDEADPAPGAVQPAVVDGGVDAPQTPLDPGGEEPLSPDALSSIDLREREPYVPPPLPAPNGPWATWDAKDIGQVPRSGRVWSQASALRVESAGAGIGGTGDSFHFVSRKVTGDFELITRVASLQMASADSTTGLMVRAGAEPGAAQVYLGVLTDRMKGGMLLARKTTNTAATTVATDVGVRDGQWLRLSRKGRVVTAYRSAQLKVNWTRVGEVEIDLPAEVLVGLATAAAHASMATTTEITALRLHSLGGQALTRDWELEELGAVASGVATYEGGSLKLAGIGEPVSLLMESGLYAFQAVSGEQMLTVKVDAFTHPNAPARVGLMLREGPAVQLLITRSSPAAIISVTADMGVVFLSRTAPNMMGTLAKPVPGLKAPIWLRLTRSEVPGQPAQSRVAGAYSLDGVTFTEVGAAVMSLPEPYLVGAYASSSGGAVPVAATLSQLSLTKPVAAPDAGAGNNDGGI